MTDARGGLFRAFHDGHREESDPLIHRAPLANWLQVGVVGVPMAFEVPGNAKGGVRECAVCHEGEQDEQSPDPSIAIEERVDRLELVMQEGCAHDRGVGLRVIGEALPVGQSLGHVLIVWRYEDRRLRARLGCADPYR